jgi:hypothetical protein
MTDGDEHWMKQWRMKQHSKMAQKNDVMKRSNETYCDGLCRRQHYKAIYVCELSSVDVQKKREIYFSFTLCFCFLFSLFFFSSRAIITRATHYMTTSSKTHRSAQSRC